MRSLFSVKGRILVLSGGPWLVQKEKQTFLTLQLSMMHRVAAARTGIATGAA